MIHVGGLNFTLKTFAANPIVDFESSIPPQHGKKLKKIVKSENGAETKIDISAEDIIDGLTWKHTGVPDKWLADHIANAYAICLNVSQISRNDLENIIGGFLGKLDNKNLTAEDIISLMEHMVRDIKFTLKDVEGRIKLYQAYNEYWVNDEYASGLKKRYETERNIINNEPFRDLTLPELPMDNWKSTYRKRRANLINFYQNRHDCLEFAKADLEGIEDWLRKQYQIKTQLLNKNDV